MEEVVGLKRSIYFLLLVVWGLIGELGLILDQTDLNAANESLEIPGYKLISNEPADLKDSTIYVYEHIKTGATVVYYNNPNDSNASFRISFKIIPEDSSGVFHVLEHSITDGSVKYPFSSDRLSYLYNLSSINASTSHDVNYYPLSSTHPKSFKELTNIYMDMVFNPLVKEDSTIFYKEGVRRVLDESGRLKNTGIVYSEMFGRQTRDVIEEISVYNELFPSGGYKYNPGGDPVVMSEQLSYDKLIEAYNKYYHPSNVLIGFYGSLDIKERLKYFDSQYFSKYERKDKVELCGSTLLPVDKSEKFQIQTKYYPGDSNLDSSKDSVVVIGYVKDDMSFKDRVAIEVLNRAILGDVELYKGAKKDLFSELKTQTIEMKSFGSYIKGYGMDSSSAVEFFSFITNYFSSLTKSSSSMSRLMSLIKPVIKAMILEETEIISSDLGADKYLPRFQNGWMYADDPLKYFYKKKVLSELFQERSEYFKNLIQEFYVNNRRRISFKLIPDKDFLKKQQEKIDKGLELINSNLSDKDQSEIIDINIRVQHLGTTQDRSDLYKNITRLTSDDIKESTSIFKNEASSETISIKSKNNSKGVDLKLLSYDLKYDEIDSVQFIYGLSHLDEEEFMYLNIYQYLITILPKKNMTADQWKMEINKYGDMELSRDWFIAKDKSIPYYSVGALITSTDAASMINLTLEGIYETLVKKIFDAFGTNISLDQMQKLWQTHREVMKMVVEDMKNNLQSNYTYGNYFNSCLNKGGSYIVPMYYMEDYLRGKSEGVSLLSKLFKDLDSEKGFREFLDKIENVRNKVFKNNLPIIAISTSDNKKLDKLKKIVTDSKLGTYLNTTDGSSSYNFNNFSKKNPKAKNSAYIISHGSSYVVESLDMSSYITYENRMEYNLIGNYLSDFYLNDNLREVKGIAYGGGVKVTMDGVFLGSWNNSDIKQTLDVYDNIYNFMLEKSSSIDEDEKFGAIIKLISKLDTPETPKGYAKRAFGNSILGINQVDIDQDRFKVLDLDLANLLRDKALEFKSAQEKSVLTVFGEKELVDSVKDRFEVVESITD